MAKSTNEIEFHPEAIREILEAIEWYSQRDKGVATEFRTLVKYAEELVQRSPESWAAYMFETHGFRFHGNCRSKKAENGASTNVTHSQFYT